MRKKHLLSSLLVASVSALMFPFYALAQSSAAPLKQFDGLKGKEREQKLSDGAKKEGRVVVYSFTAVDQLKPLLDEFQKRYLLIKPEHYRANATGVFNKFATETRAGQTLADVTDQEFAAPPRRRAVHRLGAGGGRRHEIFRREVRPDADADGTERAVSATARR